MKRNAPRPALSTWFKGSAFGLVAVLLLAATLGLVFTQGGVRAQGTFDPEVDAQLSDDEHLVNADITTSFDIPGTDYNYKVLVSFTPPGSVRMYLMCLSAPRWGNSITWPPWA